MQMNQQRFNSGLSDEDEGLNGLRVKKGDKDMFYEESENGKRWIDVEMNTDGEFDVVFKTQAFAPDGGVYAEVSRDILGFGFESESEAEKCAIFSARELGF